MRDRRGPNRVLEHQVPANDPGEDFAEGGVSVGIRRAGHRHHGSKLRITKRGKHTGNSRYHKGEHQRRTGAVMGRFAGKDENAGADNRAHPEGAQLYRPKHPAQTVFAGHFFQQQAERFRCKQFASH